MYRKKSRGWYKHKDFILIDLACLFMALILAYLIRNGSVRNLFTLGIYRNVMIFVILVDLFLIILFESYKGVLRRGRYQELRSVIRQMILIELASGLYLFTVSGGHTFSRIILYLMGIFYVLLSYCTRIIWKKRLLHKMAEGGEHSLYIVTNYDLASKVIQNVKEHNYNRYNINGLILIDKDMTGKGNKNLIDYSIKEQLLDIFPALISAVIMGVGVYFISYLSLPVIIQFAVQIIFGARAGQESVSLVW